MKLTPATLCEADLHRQEVIDFVLRILVERGGEASMKVIYDAVEVKMMNTPGFTLSKQGRASLREIVNRYGVGKGWIHKSQGGWGITSSGRKYVDKLGARPQRKVAGPVEKLREAHLPAEEVTSRGSEFIEGATRRIRVNAYERNRNARAGCIRHYGVDCVVCGFNFERTFGSAFAGFIHVHHVKPIAARGEKYVLNAVADLRPVCPNCHAVIHQKDPPFSIDQTRKMLHTRKDE